MDTVAIISRKPPYGYLNAAEAVRHTLGAGDDFKAILILIDGGVYLAKKDRIWVTQDSATLKRHWVW